MSMSRHILRGLAGCLLLGAFLGGCWEGPNVATLEIVTVEPAPGLALGGQRPRVERVSQTDLSIFFSQYENSDAIPPDVLERYLTDPQLMAAQIALLQDLVAHQLGGGAPLGPDGLYAMALQYTDDPGTALLICHNVLKAMARGQSPIPWERISPSPEDPDGPLTYSLAGGTVVVGPTHPQGIGEWPPGRPSIFYRLFDPGAFGTEDPGDWYHFFLQAAVAYYGATGRADPGGPGLGLDYYHVVGNAVEDTLGQMRDSDIGESDAYRGWRWANALSYLEGAYYGGDYNGTQEEAGRESRIHMQGAIFGLRLAGFEPQWRWFVPVIESAGPTGVNVSEGTSEIIEPPLESGGGVP